MNGYTILAALRKQVSMDIVEVTNVHEDDTSPSIFVTVKLKDGTEHTLQLSTVLACAEGPEAGEIWRPPPMEEEGRYFKVVITGTYVFKVTRDLLDDWEDDAIAKELEEAVDEHLRLGMAYDLPFKVGMAKRVPTEKVETQGVHVNLFEP